MDDNLTNNLGRPMTKHTKESITELLLSNNNAVERAMIVIQKRYTHSISSGESRHLVYHFSCYLQGINAKTKKKVWEPKSLTHKHCTPAFYKSKLISKGDIVINLARSIAIENAEMLAKLANKEKLLHPSFTLRILQWGAYKDTIELRAYRNDVVPEDKDEWPYKSKRLGPADEDEYNRKRERLSEVFNLTLEEFVENYTLVESTQYFLD